MGPSILMVAAKIANELKKHTTGWTEKHCSCCKFWGRLHSSHSTSKCHKYGKKGNRPSHAGENSNRNGGSEAGLPSIKTWVREHRLFMTIMKIIEKTMENLAKES